MKRFWLEDRWHWSTARMTLRRVPGVCSYYLFIIVVIHFVPSSSTVGETCDSHKLTPCSSNEMCVEVNKTTEVCQCLPDFEVNKATGKCEDPEPPPESPGNNNLGLALGLGITLFLVLGILILILLHRKFAIFSGMCDHFPFLHHLTIRSGDIIMVDNEDEADVNPIV